MKDMKLYMVVKPLLDIFSKICFRPKYKGISNIPKDGAFILAGNHTNILDPVMLVGVSDRVIHFLAKYELTKGLKKIIFNHMGIIPVNRSIHDSNVLKYAEEALNNGEIIGIFPEGKINKTEDIVIPFKFGTVTMAKNTNSYIVPFTINGKYRLFRKGLVIEFYKPYKVTKDITYENKKLMDIVRKGLIKEKNNGNI